MSEVLDSPASAQTVRVKICGVRTAEDAGYAVDFGAHAIGVNFYPGSKRFLPMAEAAGWLGVLQGRVLRVGVTVDAGREELLALWETGMLDALQLHGSESPELCSELAGLGIPVIKAITLANAAELQTIDTYPEAADVLIDAHVPGEFGGTGHLADWSLARECVRRLASRRVYLAGGLCPENVAEAIRAVRPFAVDVASGVERATGVKDPALVREFLRQARKAA